MTRLDAPTNTRRVCLLIREARLRGVSSSGKRSHAGPLRPEIKLDSPKSNQAAVPRVRELSSWLAACRSPAMTWAGDASFVQRETRPTCADFACTLIAGSRSSRTSQTAYYACYSDRRVAGCARVLEPVASKSRFATLARCQSRQDARRDVFAGVDRSCSVDTSSCCM